MFGRALAFFAAAFALVACGNAASESAPTSALPAALPAQAAAAVAMPVATPPPESAQCLDLVGTGAFAKAVPVCMEAADLDPGNVAVKQALGTARTQAAHAALGSSPAIPSTGDDRAVGALGTR